MNQTITDKIFQAHLRDEPFPGTKVLSIDRVLCHEITTPIAIADLVWRKKDRVFDAAKIKAVIDHVTPAKDSATAEQGKVLRDWAHRHGVEFFDIGCNGVCHAIFPEKGLIRPGYTVVMGDSHTCTHGAFGAFAAGVGTTDLEVAILKGICAFRQPHSIRVTVSGNLSKGVYAKDVILEVIRQLTVNGATDHVVEFVGETISAMSMEERMTVCNMAVEAGATSGICMPDKVTLQYLWPFISAEYGDDKAKALAAFEALHSEPGAAYKKELSIHAPDLEPVATVGYKPDQVKKLKELSDTRINQVYIGSCTNGRLSDLEEAVKIVRGRKLAKGVRGIVSPATPDVYRQAMDKGILAVFMDAGYCVTNPTCGACLGMSNGVLAEGEVCASTTNRNFSGRMGKGGMVHLMSPASAAASGVTGKLTDPREFL